jgi:processive 1,2-diacylglycerol beta-glucosyltransferase
LRRIDPAARVQIVDSYEYAASVVSRVVSDGYLQMVKTIPQMYRYIYRRAERATEVGPFRTWAHQVAAGNLRPLILRSRPDVVVCTHAFPCGAMAEYSRLYGDAPPTVGIVTDFAVHAFWMHETIDAYVVATPAVAEAMIARGIDPLRIVSSGIPVRSEFAEVPADRAVLRERLGLPHDRRIVLLMAGGLGIGPLERMMRALEDVEVPLAAVAIAGRSERTQRRVLTAANDVRYPVRALGFVDNVYDYVHAADAFVTKPGGLSVAEGLASGVPMVLCKPLPGQEERNARFLTESGAAARVRRLADLPAVLTAVLRDPQRYLEMKAAAARLARPHAAADAARTIARLAGTRKEIVA